MLVKSRHKNNRVLLWERDKRHPNGEIYIVNDQVIVEVAPTKRVKDLINDQLLIVVEDSIESNPPVEPLAIESDSDKETIEVPTEQSAKRKYERKK